MPRLEELCWVVANLILPEGQHINPHKLCKNSAQTPHKLCTKVCCFRQTYHKTFYYYYYYYLFIIITCNLHSCHSPHVGNTLSTSQKLCLKEDKDDARLSGPMVVSFLLFLPVPRNTIKKISLCSKEDKEVMESMTQYEYLLVITMVCSKEGKKVMELMSQDK